MPGVLIGWPVSATAVTTPVPLPPRFGTHGYWVYMYRVVILIIQICFGVYVGMHVTVGVWVFSKLSYLSTSF